MFKKTSTVPSELPPAHVDVPPIIPEPRTKTKEDILAIDAGLQGSASFIPFAGQMPIGIRIPAAQKLADFLKENNMVLTPTVMNSECFILDGGIVVNDKPLIKIQVEYSK